MSGTDGLSNHIRKYLLDKTNYTCEIPGCGCNFINPYTLLNPYNNVNCIYYNIHSFI